MSGGIALASACDDCAWLISSPPAVDGRRMAPVHDDHIPWLVVLGWRVTHYDNGEPPDVVCEHYHAAYWQGP